MIDENPSRSHEMHTASGYGRCSSNAEIIWWILYSKYFARALLKSKCSIGVRYEIVDLCYTLQWKVTLDFTKTPFEEGGLRNSRLFVLQFAVKLKIYEALKL